MCVGNPFTPRKDRGGSYKEHILKQTVLILLRVCRDFSHLKAVLKEMLWGLGGKKCKVLHMEWNDACVSTG